ncbi:MAG: exosortase/archaeosortase family protein, partial [Planctomycetota bacterium]
MEDNIVSSVTSTQAEHDPVCEHSKMGPDRERKERPLGGKDSNTDPPYSRNSKSPNSVHINWLELGLHNYVKILIIGGLFVYLFRNEIQPIVYRWRTDSSWSHGFLIPLFSLYFINQAKNKILSIQTRPNYLGLVFLICGIMFYLFNIVSPSGYAYFRPMSMIAALGAVVLFLGGWALIKYTWLPIAFLVFAVPLPNRYYVSLTMPMRKLATVVATALLNLVSQMEATASGVVIDVIYKGQRLEPP